jgi:hypothetical protein
MHDSSRTVSFSMTLAVILTACSQPGAAVTDESSAGSTSDSEGWASSGAPLEPLEADVDELSADINPVTAGTCTIQNDTCPLHPANAGTFNESQPSQAACFQRAVDWRSYCGTAPAPNLGSVAIWVANASALTNNFSAYSPGCQVKIAACPYHPEFANKSIWDDYQGAGSDPARCTTRAKEYADWCGRPGAPGVVQTRFNTSLSGVTLTPGGSNQTLVGRGYARGCVIRNERCVNHPEYAGVDFVDNWNGSATDEAACMNRASDYVQWCGGTDAGLDVSRATFYPGGLTTGFGPFQGTSSRFEQRYAQGCRIHNRACPAHPEYAYRSIADNWNNSGSNPAACQQRANDYRGWCGGGIPGFDYTIAEYIPSAGAASAAYKYAYTPGCRVDISVACPDHPDFSNRKSIVDNWNGSATNEAACNQRASDYYYWCGLTSESNVPWWAVQSTFTDAAYQVKEGFEYPGYPGF